MLKIKLVVVLGFGFASQLAGAGELVHGFVNPDFGGNPLNGSYLLSNASAQNTHKADVSKTSTSSSSLGSTSSSTPSSATQFSQQVNDMVVSSLAYRLVNQAFGNSSGNLPTNSSINTGINTITVNATSSGTTVTIVDNKTGGSSVITIPNF
jgi:curli production assembly/transport component CsgF